MIDFIKKIKMFMSGEDKDIQPKREPKVKEVWSMIKDNPFERYTVTILEIKENHVKYRRGRGLFMDEDSASIEQFISWYEFNRETEY